MLSASAMERLAILRGEFEVGARQFPEVDLHMIHAGRRHEDRINEHPFPNLKRAYGPPVAWVVYEHIVGQDAHVELHKRRRYWLQGDSVGQSKYKELVAKIADLLAHQTLEGAEETSLREHDRESRWLGMLFELALAGDSSSVLCSQRLSWFIENQHVKVIPWHPHLEDFWYSRIDKIYQASVLGIERILLDYAAPPKNCEVDELKDEKCVSAGTTAPLSQCIGAGKRRNIKESMTRKYARDKAIDYVKRYGYPSIRKLAKEVGCSPTTMHEAIQDSAYLKNAAQRKQQEDHAKRRSSPGVGECKSINGSILDGVEQNEYRSPEDMAILNEEKIRTESLEQLIEEQEKDKKADRYRSKAVKRKPRHE